MKTLIILLLLCISIVLAKECVQSDWSGNDGVWGPVLSWNDDYCSKSQLLWNSDLEALQIESGISAHLVHDSFPSPRSVFSEDVNGDGFNDVISVSSTTDEILWFENDGYATTWTQHIVETDFDGVKTMHASDIDCDGDIDIIAGAFTGDEIAWWENNGGTGLNWVKHSVEIDYDGPNTLYTCDIDSDGDIDIVAGSFFNEEVSWWENTDGSGINWVKHSIQSGYYSVADIYANDIDIDGDIDIIAVGLGSSELLWWENTDGAGLTWTNHIADAEFWDGNSVHAGDLDGDGDIDLLGTKSGYHYNLYWYENVDGSATLWEKNLLAMTWKNANSVYSIDLDNDGDLDVVGAAGNNVNPWILFENVDGNGNFNEVYLYPYSFYGLNSIYAKDLNGDGYVEILVTSGSSDCVVQYNFGLTGWLESSLLDMEVNNEWGMLDWTESSGEDCEVSFQVRSSMVPDSSAMGEWSLPIYEPSTLNGVLADGDRYVQYRTILASTKLDSTPFLSSVSIGWDSVASSIEDQNQFDSPISLQVINPVRVTPSITFTLAENADVTLLLFDMAGRVLENYTEKNCAEGVHLFNFTPREEGVYFVRLLSNGAILNRRFVVLE